jgi:subtilase family serine protease
MKAARCLALAGSIGLALGFTAAIAGPAAARTPAPGRIALRGTMTPAQERTHPDGQVAASTSESFDLTLSLRNAAGAQNFVREVSSPGSKLFHHYLTDAQWVSRFGPTNASLATAQAWLRRQGFSGISVPKTHLFVSARGSAAQIERAFSVSLGYYIVNGRKVQLANGALTVPSSLAGAVSGVVGVNQYLETNDLAVQGRNNPATKPNQEPGPPGGFRNPQPCSKAWGTTPDTADSSSLYTPYTGNDYDICGYLPHQIRSAYGINTNSDDNGTGVGVAIVDAYDSPTLLSDAQRYFAENDHTNPLSSAQFFNDEPATVDDQAECGGSGWYAEQALDVESVHTMAPGADILFVGAQDCLDTSLLAALQTAITSGASVVSDSWGDTLGDLFDDAASKAAYDDTFMVADSTGVSVLFSSGDSGDNFAASGLAAPNYPPSSPFITAVGGTTLEINSAGNQIAQYGWSTAKQELCVGVTPTNCGSSTTPTDAAPAYQAGGGGGTSYTYSQPFYQAGVVPSALALRNEALFGPVPLRVDPDISMDADAQSGLLIGLTQVFPHGTHYGEFKEGGTSLASPLLAGVIADADEVAGGPLGFLNPILYNAYIKAPTAFENISPPATPDAASVIRVDYANEVDSTDGYNVSLRVINYEGPETYCDGTNNCATRNVTLSTGPGFNSMTGLGSIGADFIAAMSQY